MVKRVRKVLKGLVFGSASFPQQCSIGLHDPQSEISVWLHGLGQPRDVTQNNVIASARPFTIGIGLERTLNSAEASGMPLSLQFRERDGEQRLLGVIRLRLNEVTTVGLDQVGFFEILSCTNYCVPRARLWARYADRIPAVAFPNTPRLECADGGTRSPQRVRFLHLPTSGRSGQCCRWKLHKHLSHGSNRARRNAAFFPSAAQHQHGGALDGASRRIALSSVPIEQTSVAYQLGRNHNKKSVEADEIPFATTKSAAFALPVPCFALRVREMQIESVRTVGSHTLFLARTVEDCQLAEGLQLFFVHGFYQAWRCRQRPSLLAG